MSSWLETHRLSLVLVLLAIIAVGAVVWLQKLDDRRPLVIQSSTPTPLPGGARVFVSGAVARPGVYPIAPGDRVDAALALAGGPTDDADLSAINLAARLRDEQRVHIPRRDEAAAPGSVSSPADGPPATTFAGRLVDLNTASAAELESLPGIGPVTAGRIIAARDSGGFRSVDELREKKLVNSSTFEKIKGRVTVGDAALSSYRDSPAVPAATPMR